MQRRKRIELVDWAKWVGVACKQPFVYRQFATIGFFQKFARPAHRDERVEPSVQEMVQV